MKKENLTRNLTFFAAAVLVAAAFLCDSPGGIAEGMWRIMTSHSLLITDFFSVGGMGAAFFNAAIILLTGVILVMVEKIPFTGPTMAALFINAGYGLWGKTPLNILPILFGIWLYSRTHGVRLGRHIYTALFGTCLAPFVTELYFLLPYPLVVRAAMAVALGIVVGFFLPPLSAHTTSMHMGYNLFNVGFSAGILAFVIVCVMKSLELQTETVLLWETGRPVGVIVGLYLFFLAVFITGFLYSDRKLDGLKKIFSRPGRAVSDFILMDGAGPAMMNMGLMGSLCTTYILLIGGDFSGPVVGAIMMVFGFSAFGAHVKNYLPVLAGVWLFTFVSRYEPTTPGIQLAAIFGIGLSPIAGQFGIPAGILAGILHSAVAMCTAQIYGGLNLYNNGFSAGWVAVVLIPALESFIKRYQSRKRSR